MNGSEQQEGLELDAERQALDEPTTWRRQEPDRVRESSEQRPEGLQLSTPGGGGEPEDDEPDEIAVAYEPSATAGAEQQAMRPEAER